jgi:hypothetical protein
MLDITCEHCGYKWKSDVFDFGFATVTFSNNVKTECPNCGQLTKIENGTYRFDQNGVAEVLRQIPKKDLRKVQLAAVSVHENGGTADDFQNALSQINPVYSILFASILATLKDKNFQFWMKWVLGVLALFNGGEIFRDANINVTINNVVNNNRTEVKKSYSEDYASQLRRKNLEALKLKKDTTAKNRNLKK